MLHRFFAAVVGLALSVAVVAAGCQASTAAPTAQDAKQFLDEVNATFDRLYLDANRAGWVAQNFITVDSEAMDERGTQAVSDASSRFAKQAVRFDNVEVPADHIEAHEIKTAPAQVAEDRTEVTLEDDRERARVVARRRDGFRASRVDRHTCIARSATRSSRARDAIVSAANR